MRINRNIQCAKANCLGKPLKTNFLEDGFESEVCASEGCGEVVSYIRHGKKKAEVRKDSKEAIKNKTDKASERIKNIKLRETTIENLTPSNESIEINKVYFESCETTLARMKDKSIDYIFTSPPYNIADSNIAGDKYTSNTQKYKDSMTQQQYLDWQVSLIEQFLRVTKKHIFYNNQLLTNNKNVILELLGHFKYNIKDIAIWNKRSVSPATCAGVFNSQYEFIIIFSNQTPEDRNFKDGNFQSTFSNVVEVKKERNEYSDINSAVFPIDFPRKFIINFGKEGDIWYDPFGGTGTTALAAIMEKRNWILSEMDKNSVKVIMKRIENLTGNPQVKLF